MSNLTYDLSTAKKNPYAEKLKEGYAIRIIVPPEEERRRELNNFYVTDDELEMLKDFVASEELKRKMAKR